MGKIEDLTEQFRRQKAHTFCKQLLAIKRKKYKCPQNRIAALFNPVGYWFIYIDPEGFVGSYKGCCRWSAMIKALDDKFSTKEEG